MKYPSHGPASERRAVRICLLLAVAFTLLGVREFFHEGARVFSGHKMGLRQFLYYQFGDAGVAAVWFVTAVLALVFARLFWRHASKVPGDRWYHR